MEYKIITPGDSKYPQKLIKRLGDKCPDKIYYSGQLELLDHFTIAVICSDKSGGITLIDTNQVLFTVREYEMNYIGGWHSVIETEIFRLSLFRKNTTTTLFSAKGLDKETYESFLKDRFYPPLHEFPERDEYFRRANNGNLLMLSVSDPDETRQLRKNIMERNWLSCVLADIVFIPYGPKSSKTYTIAKRIREADIPAFTTDSDECRELGIPGFNRKTVKAFLEVNGAKRAVLRENINSSKEVYNKPISQQLSFIKETRQTELKFKKKSKNNNL